MGPPKTKQNNSFQLAHLILCVWNFLPWIIIIIKNPISYILKTNEVLIYPIQKAFITSPFSSSVKSPNVGSFFPLLEETIESVSIYRTDVSRQSISEYSFSRAWHVMNAAIHILVLACCSINSSSCVHWNAAISGSACMNE